jgi:hypothetical protein
MKVLGYLRNALVGWLAGLLFALGSSWLWQQVFPVVDRTGTGPTLLIVLLTILAIVSPFAIAGGVIGGRLPREGGINQQIIYAALFGALFQIPFSCFLFWFLQW